MGDKYYVWIVILVLYALIVGILLAAELPETWRWVRSPEWVATITLGLLLLILGFWYFAPTCRASLWMPFLAVLVAVLGLIAAFRDHPRVTQIIFLKEGGKK